MKKRDIYIKLFTSTFYLSAFTFGGGYVIIPLMKRKFVDELKWLEENEMLDMTAIAQSSPGPVAVNASILLGYRLLGIRGALVAALGTVLPPLLILLAISMFYDAFRTNPVVNAVLRAMKPAIVAVICDVVFSMGAGIVKKGGTISVCIMLGAFFAGCVLNVNVMIIVLVSALIGLALTIKKEREQRK